MRFRREYRSRRGQGVGRRPGDVAVRVGGVGLRRRLRRGRGDGHRRPGPRPGRQPDRHRRGLRSAGGRSASSAGRIFRAAGRGVRRHQGVAGGPAGGVGRGAQGQGQRRTAGHRDPRPLPGALAEPLVPLRSTMAGMRRLQDAGVVRHVGVSNFSRDRWQAAEEALGAPVLSNQVRYSLVSRKPEGDLLAYAAATDRLVIAYSPLAQGLLEREVRAPRTARRRRSGWPAPCSYPRTSTGPRSSSGPLRPSPPSTTPRRPRWRWRGSSAGPTPSSSPVPAPSSSSRPTSPPPSSTSPMPRTPCSPPPPTPSTRRRSWGHPQPLATANLLRQGSLGVGSSSATGRPGCRSWRRCRVPRPG